MIPESWIPWIAGLFGLALGSFLNVCSLRWPVDESVVSPPSHCPRCGRGLRWYDNVPVLSWLMLRGRCRGCGEGISVQYPMVELTVGLVWAGLFYRFGLEWEAVRGAVFLTLLLGIALSDARFYIIPDPFSLGGAALGLVFAFLPGGIDPVPAALGALLWFVVLWAFGSGTTWALRRWAPERLEEKGVDQALGGGDVKMMAMVGAFLGPLGGFTTLFLGSILGLVVFAPISRATGKLIPFGIFLAAGAAVSYGWGEPLLNWYLGAVGF